MCQAKSRQHIAGCQLHPPFHLVTINESLCCGPWRPALFHQVPDQDDQDIRSPKQVSIQPGWGSPLSKCMRYCHIKNQPSGKKKKALNSINCWSALCVLLVSLGNSLLGRISSLWYNFYFRMITVKVIWVRNVTGFWPLEHLCGNKEQR